MSLKEFIQPFYHLLWVSAKNLDLNLHPSILCQSKTSEQVIAPLSPKAKETQWVDNLKMHLLQKSYLSIAMRLVSPEILICPVILFIENNT